MNQEQLNKLSKHGMFKSLNKNELDLVSKNSILLNFKRGETIFKQGTPNNHLVFLLNGLVKTYKEINDSTNRITFLIIENQFVNLSNGISKLNNIQSAAAIEDSTCLMIDVNILTEIMKSNNNFAIDAVEYISKKDVSGFDFILYLQHKQTQGRLATALIYFYKEVYRNTKFRLTISRKEIAEVVGMSNENIVRELTRFGKEGIIKTEGRMMEIINPEKLQKISDLG